VSKIRTLQIFDRVINHLGIIPGILDEILLAKVGASSKVGITRDVRIALQAHDDMNRAPTPSTTGFHDFSDGFLKIRATVFCCLFD
jgi:hypothetical protein